MMVQAQVLMHGHWVDGQAQQKQEAQVQQQMVGPVVQRQREQLVAEPELVQTGSMYCGAMCLTEQ